MIKSTLGMFVCFGAFLLLSAIFSTVVNYNHPLSGYEWTVVGIAVSFNAGFFFSGLLHILETMSARQNNPR